MKDPIKYFFRVGPTLVVAGLCVATFGAIKIMQFLRHAKSDALFTVKELVKSMIVPHMITLLGVGLFGAGVVLIVSGILFIKRDKNS